MQVNLVQYLFQDVPGNRNCAFHTVCRSNLIPPMEAGDLRGAVCEYARTKGRSIAVVNFQHYAVPEDPDLTLDQYLDIMSCNRRLHVSPLLHHIHLRPTEPARVHRCLGWETMADMEVLGSLW